MGISDLIPFLKKHVPNCFVETPAYNLNRKRIAIDAYNWVFTYLGICVKNTSSKLKDPFDSIKADDVFNALVKEFVRFNTKLLTYKITPIWIWDGDSVPAKLDTKTKRREERLKRTEKRDNIKNQLMEMNVLERPTELIETYRKLQADTFYFPINRITDLKDVCDRFGIPSITAKGEGEHLAASLAVERIVACVWSADTDTFAMGAPFITHKFEYRNKKMFITGVFTPTILKTLNLTYQEFRDFCILCGCDFGKRMKGIGPKKSLQLIQKYKSIEEIDLNNDKLDICCLNHNKCRELLTPSVSELTDDDLNIRSEEYDIDLDKYNCKNEIEIMFSRSRNFPKSENIPKFN